MERLGKSKDYMCLDRILCYERRWGSGVPLQPKES